MHWFVPTTVENCKIFFIIEVFEVEAFEERIGIRSTFHQSDELKRLILYMTYIFGLVVDKCIWHDTLMHYAQRQISAILSASHSVLGIRCSQCSVHLRFQFSSKLHTWYHRADLIFVDSYSVRFFFFFYSVTRNLSKSEQDTRTIYQRAFHSPIPFNSKTHRTTCNCPFASSLLNIWSRAPHYC